MHATDGATGFGYRAYLDGLRAVAVSSVFAYHLDAAWMRGGFLGVDAFFVLSGYLITSLLVSEHERTGGISLVKFWARRVRRLFPALFIVLIGVAAAVRLFRPAPEWPLAQADLIWTILYGANWRQIATSQDYFSAFVAASPLRHMWSIAIEEQFYLLWPLTVWFARRHLSRRGWIVLLGAGILASAACQWWLFDPANPTRAYVGTDSRAHELLIGAGLAFLLRRWRASAATPATAASAGAPVVPLLPAEAARSRDGWPTWWARTSAIVGGTAAASLLALMIALPDTTRFYYGGGSVLASVLVAALIASLEHRPTGVLARCLGARPLAFVGRISYGLYLWHWPVIVFLPTILVMTFGARGMRFLNHGAALVAVTVAVTFALAVGMYVLVERPIRYGRSPWLARPAFLAAATVAAMAIFVFGIVSRLDVPVTLRGQVNTASDCSRPACLVVNSGANRPVLAIMGDSIALSMGPAFERLAREFDWTFVSGAHNRCTVLHHMLAVGNWGECYDSVPVTEREVLSYRPDVIVVSDNWIWVDALGPGGQVLKSMSAEHVSHVETKLQEAVSRLADSGALVVLLHLAPSSQAIECADPIYARGAPERCKAPDRDPKFDIYNAVLDRVAARDPERVKVVDVRDVLCPARTCSAKLDGIIVRFDTMHFSTEGARWMAPRLARKLREAGVRLEL